MRPLPTEEPIRSSMVQFRTQPCRGCINTIILCKGGHLLYWIVSLTVKSFPNVEVHLRPCCLFKWVKQSTRTTGVQNLDASEGSSSLGQSHSIRWTSTEPYLYSSNSLLSGGCFFHWLLVHFVASPCMRATLYPSAWTPVDVTSEFDLDSWEESDIFGASLWFLVLAVLNVTSSLVFERVRQGLLRQLASRLQLKSLIATRI